MIATGKLFALPVVAFALESILWGQQQTSSEFQFPPMPVLTCRTVQLQSEDGKPVADAPVQLRVAQVKMAKGNTVGAEVTFKLLRKFKTDAGGKVQLPMLKPNTYYLQLPEATKFTSGAFAIVDGSKPGDCTQTFILTDHGYMIHLESPVSGEAADKK